MDHNKYSAHRTSITLSFFECDISYVYQKDIINSSNKYQIICAALYTEHYKTRQIKKQKSSVGSPY